MYLPVALQQHLQLHGYAVYKLKLTTDHNRKIFSDESVEKNYSLHDIAAVQ
jgi:hypothetical protein